MTDDSSPVAGPRGRLVDLVCECLRSGTIASLAMMPFGLALRASDLRVGHYGPKFSEWLFGMSPAWLLFAQHLAIGWVSALPLLLWLPRRPSLAGRLFAGAVYGVAYYVAVNSLALPLFFGDPTPWSLGLAVVVPSLVVHIVFGLSIGLTGGAYAARAAATTARTPARRRSP